MKKQLMIVLIVLTLLSLSGCGIARNILERKLGANDTETEEVSAEVNVPEQPAEEVKEEPKEEIKEEIPEEPVEEEVPAEPWKDVYLALLEEEISAEPQDNEYGNPIEFSNYWLYDIDKNDVPELILKTGTCEADYYGTVYTCKNGEALEVGGFYLGHANLGTCPDENGVLLKNGHMGYSATYKYTLENDKLSDEEMLFEEDLSQKMYNDDSVWYTPISEIVPGAFSLAPYYPNSFFAVEAYDEITAIQKGELKFDTSKASYPEDDPEFYNKVMEESREVISVPLDVFVTNPGKVNFKEMLEPGTIDEYLTEPMIIQNSYETDVDGDGIIECILYLGSGQSDYANNRVILKGENGKVYAYLDAYPGETEVTPEGVFLQDESYNPDYAMRVLLDGEDGCEYSIPKP